MNHTSKKILITGATDGIGKVTAKALCQQGHEVWILGRDKIKTETVARELGAKSLVVDLSRPSQINAVCTDFATKNKALDVLINNAGGIFVKREITEEGLEKTFALNHLAYFLMTKNLLPLLKMSKQARIVNVASDAHYGIGLDFKNLQGELYYNPWMAYKRSKLMNILFTKELSNQLKGTNITTNCLHPGFVASKFGHNNAGVWKKLIQMSQTLFAINENKGAMTSIFLASNPDLAGISGEYFVKCKIQKPSKYALDTGLAKSLWDKTEEILRVHKIDYQS